MPGKHSGGSQPQNDSSSFVPCLPTDAQYMLRKNRRGAAHRLSCRLSVTLVTVSPLFIGSGTQVTEQTEDGPHIVRQTLTENGRAVIPGSGLRGAVRQICRAVSHSCMPPERGLRLQLPPGTLRACIPQKEPPADTGCIVCDLFGKPGWASKVSFGDLVSAADPPTVRIRMPRQRAALQENAGQSGFYAYKFYRTDTASAENPDGERIRAAGCGVTFTGEIICRNLSEEELDLLLFALGQSHAIALKLGAFRNAGLGTVRLSLTSDEISDIAARAGQYEANPDAGIRRNIAVLKAHMPRHLLAQNA